MRDCITVLETEDGILTQVRVRSDKCASVVLPVSEGVDWVVVTVLVLVEHVSMSVGERAALDILSTDAHVVALVN